MLQRKINKVTTSDTYDLFHYTNNKECIIFIVAPCIMDSLNLLHTNKCTVIL